MATVTRENIGLLTDKLTVKVTKEDYLPTFETSLKKYAKTANIPGFRKGMVPASLVKKMYGQGAFADEVLRTIEKNLTDYLAQERLDIFAQPMPLETDSSKIDMNNPVDYSFAFEIGLKPEFNIDISTINVTRYVIEVTNEMVNEEVGRLQVRHGKMTEPETVTSDEDVLNVDFTETDAAGNEVENGITKSNSLLVKYFNESIRPELMGKKIGDSIELQLSKAFDEKEKDWLINDLGLDKEDATAADKFFKLTITKVGLVEKAEMNEEFFETVYPARGIKTEDEFRDAVKAEIDNYYKSQSSNQLQDQIYHHLTDHTSMEFPEGFLKRWLKDGGEKQKSVDEAEEEYPTFANQLKWSLISSKLLEESSITVDPEEIKDFAKHQIMSYMGGQSIGDNSWMDEYANRMMKDKKFVEETYMRIQTSKMFAVLEGKVNAKEESISAEAFAEKLHHHHH
ncbi:MAG: trigger factor [Panacibacter sp.]